MLLYWYCYSIYIYKTYHFSPEKGSILQTEHGSKKGTENIFPFSVRNVDSLTHAVTSFKRTIYFPPSLRPFQRPQPLIRSLWANTTSFPIETLSQSSSTEKKCFYRRHFPYITFVFDLDAIFSTFLPQQFSYLVFVCVCCYKCAAAHFTIQRRLTLSSANKTIFLSCSCLWKHWSSWYHCSLTLFSRRQRFHVPRPLFLLISLKVNFPNLICHIAMSCEGSFMNLLVAELIFTSAFVLTLTGLSVTRR